ncbi:MAG: enoyl-CoA hydratase/isomerase family protein, partial [Pseudonocardia sp.]
MTELVHLIRDTCAEIVLDNPPMNVVTTELTAQLRQVLRAVAADDDVRAVVVSGAGGRAFCAGSDIAEFESLHGRAAEEKLLLEKLVYRQLALLPVPTIAAIEGHALGGGLELALCCDRRVAGDNAKVGQPEILLGIIPGAGGTQRLARLVGPAKAKDIVFTGRFVGAQEALRIGLVDEVVAPDGVYEAALAWASQFTGGAAIALAAAKAAIDGGLDGDLNSGLRLESQLFAG